jgi:uncharacterized protein (TIGR02246 family)
MHGTRCVVAVLTLCSTLTLSCAHATVAGPADAAPVRAAIEVAYAGFVSALTRGDADALAAYFTEDAVLAYPGMKGFVTGRVAIRDYWAARFQSVRFLEAAIVPAEVRVDGDLAWETGTNRLVVKSGDTAPATRTARYLVAWKRGADGRWLIQADAVVPDPAG